VSLYAEKAVVLRTWKLGEADRIVSLLTETHGKVRAVAKGVRKSTSKIGGRVEPFSVIDVRLWKGSGELQRVSQVELLQAHSQLHEDFNRLSKASAIVEIVDKISVEEVDSSVLYRLVTRALHALNESDSPLFLGVFFLRLLELEGFAPQLDRCGTCGSIDDLAYFDVDSGEVACRVHAGGFELTASVLMLLRRARAGRIRDLLQETDQADTRVFEAIAARYVQQSFALELRSLRGVVL
jgi:DNA repair protein RecO (recombination protein O)